MAPLVATINNGAHPNGAHRRNRAKLDDGGAPWKCDRCGKVGKFKVVVRNGRQLCDRCADSVEFGRNCFYDAFLSVWELEIKGRAIGERRLGAISYLRDVYLSDLRKYDPQLESIMPKVSPSLSDDDCLSLYESLTARSGGCFGDEYHPAQPDTKVATVPPQLLQSSAEVITADTLMAAIMSQAGRDVKGDTPLSGDYFLRHTSVSVNLHHPKVASPLVVAVSLGAGDPIRPVVKRDELIGFIEKAQNGRAKVQHRSLQSLNGAVDKQELAAEVNRAVIETGKRLTVNMRGVKDWNVRIFKGVEVICL